MKNVMLVLVAGVALAGCQTLSTGKIGNPFVQHEAPVVVRDSGREGGRFTDRVVAKAQGRPVVQNARGAMPRVGEQDLMNVEPAAGRYPSTAASLGAMLSHTVQPGETLYKIARQYDTKADAVMAANNLTSSAEIEEGMVLSIPTAATRLVHAPDAHRQELLGRSRAVDAAVRAVENPSMIEPAAGRVPAGKPTLQPEASAGVVKHTVVAGETVYRIGKQYGASVIDILTTNNLDTPEELQVGMVLTVPVSGAEASTQPVRVVANVDNAAETVKTVAAQKAPKSNVKRGQVDPVAAAADGFAWPVQGGKVVKRFGEQGNGVTYTGINIKVPANTPVVAAERGQVIYAGGGLKTYGNLVLVRHGNGLVTAYAHNSELLVNKGDTVKKGQVVALSGASGNVSTPQLHFEVRRNARAVNPMSMLASR